MTYTDDSSPPDAATLAEHSPWEACDHCQAPLEAGQRYCVSCGSRRAQADDPAARYFVTAARRARTSAAAPVAATPAGAPTGGIRTALLLALLPVVAAIGIFIGRGGDDGDKLLVEALKAQKAPVVNVGAGGGGGAAAADGGGAKKKKGADETADAADGEVIGRGAYGTARKLTGAKATPVQLEESKEAIDKIVNSKGKEYVEQQRGLPDQIIVP
jgi:hypothetical protein